jgi:ABC-type polysaccharide/polyol phosphate transport system ATPase subunit
MPSIKFEGVSKTFLRNTSRMLLRGHLLRRFTSAHKDRFYALRHVSFEIREGESVGVVGFNGAGKSTLLSLVAGISYPDEGRVLVDGRIAALLELGSGFHGDLTGAENVFLNASLLGLPHQRTRDIYPDIVEFSGIGDFINEPLRTYSSGMVMRLAFSVAINVDPDFLIVDEVLAVGDRSFQAKCYEKIMDFKRNGKGLLCVSHAATTIQQLCERAIWLDHGEIVMDGATSDVVEAYAGKAAAGTAAVVKA